MLRRKKIHLYMFLRVLFSGIHLIFHIPAYNNIAVGVTRHLCLGKEDPEC